MNGRLSTPVAEMLNASVPPPAGPADSSAHAVIPTTTATAVHAAAKTLGNHDIRHNLRLLNIGYTIRITVI
ncbi:hypothetical protein MMAGJ_54450 [Mycolicibacterium mageritense]|uniref:Uncharacterized protein n=1 Tax=Mycolicibacterium mageritense TaxID=53462 RepID=A0ABM7HZY9_MYCME|nr:hypothetical protein MMAGJ_54450 [Mycolicibacterium mageritense]